MQVLLAILASVAVVSVGVAIPMAVLLGRLVRPVLASTTNETDAGGWRTVVVNHGLGPALVVGTYYAFEVDGEDAVECDTGLDLGRALHARLGAVEGRDFELVDLSGGALGSGEERHLGTVAGPLARRITRLTVSLTCRTTITPARWSTDVDLVPARPSRSPAPV